MLEFRVQEVIVPAAVGILTIFKPKNLHSMMVYASADLEIGSGGAKGLPVAASAAWGLSHEDFIQSKLKATDQLRIFGKGTAGATTARIVSIMDV